MNRVLIANRGEIALRIIRGCHEEGIEAVAVYSEADRVAPHVKGADAAVEIGPAAARDSYLNVERIIDAARKTGAEAVHPGYGFLAERAHFAQAVVDAGLRFIGPPASAIRLMGEKTEARRRMANAGVPIVPGTTEALADADQAVAEAEGIGYPVLLKAAAGGGGKGMRIARSAAEVRKGFAQASSEASAAFGDGSVYLERFLERPRHVEIQILADAHGRVVHLGERECSVQRRHQKLIEETPSPAVDRELRMRMGEAAVRAAESVEYVSAGTVEFLLDPAGDFYFLEMNTRTGAAADRGRGAAVGEALEPGAARSRHRVPHHRGRSLRSVHAGHWASRVPPGAHRPGGTVGRRDRDRERRGPVLRLPAWQADRVG
jgi:acetyl/propionyl-CoA carboxylase alpha subunit